MEDGLTRAVERLAVRFHRHANLKRISDDDWESFLQAHPYDGAGIWDGIAVDQGDKDVFVPCEQDSEGITVTLPVASDDVEVTSTEIRSPVLRGRWWGCVSEVRVEGRGDRTMVKLRSDTLWPVLIRGGEVDGLSAYFLACLAVKLESSQWALDWLRVGAQSGRCSPLHALVATLAALDDETNLRELVAWSSRAVLTLRDDECAFVLARALLSLSGVENNQIAAGLLRSLVRRGYAAAYGVLGRIYAQGAEGIEADAAEARQLLTIAQLMAGDEDAAQIIARLRRPSDAQSEGSVTARERLGRWSRAGDWALAALGVAAAAGIGLWAWTRYKARHGQYASVRKAIALW